MQRTSTWIIGALLLTGCQAPPPAGSTPEPVAEAASALSIEEACPSSTWVGRLPAGSPCPVPGSGWVATEVFPGAGPPLPTYCRYDWNDDPNIPNTDTLPAEPGKPHDGIEWLDRDCRVVTALTDDSTPLARDVVAEDLFTTFRQAIGAPTSITYPEEGAPVRVAVIDSMPPPPALGRSRHGFAVASIIRTLACAGNGLSCPVQVRPYLALDIKLDGTRDPDQGGYFGSHSRIAEKIYEAVHDWVVDDKPGYLVLNLSLGWDASYNDDGHGDLPTGVQAVRDALVYARCQGALVLAAAGNASSGENPTTGPMYPAAWETAVYACPNTGQSYPALVYAVGGTDAAASNVPWARPGARPELVADGYLVPALYHNGTGVTSEGLYSGTSVSTAAVTAAAAAVLARDTTGTMTAEDVAARLYNTGVSVGVSANFCGCASPPCACPETRRLCFRKAIGGAPCPATPIANPTVTPGQLSAVQASYEDGTVDASDMESPLWQIDCEGDMYSSASVAPAAGKICPTEHRPNEIILPFSTTQPGVPVCGVCILSVPGGQDASVLEIGMNEELRDPVAPGSLSLIDDSGQKVARYDLRETGPLSPGSVTRVLLPAINETFRYAVIEWPLDDVAAATSDVVLVQQQ